MVTPLETNMYYTYVLQSKKDGKWYTGAMDNLRKRLIEHNTNLVRSTKGRGPFEIIYYEACLNQHDAFVREKYLKTGIGKRYLKNRLKRFLSLTGQGQVYSVRGRLPMATVTSNGGFLTLEMLIAFGILAITISAVILVVFGNQSVTVDAQTNSEALYKAQLALETARANAKLDFNLVNPTTLIDGIYSRSLSVTQVDSWTKKVVSNVSWNAEGGRQPSVALTTLLTNPQGVANGTTCNSVLSNANGWKSPKAYHWDFGQLGVNGNNGNGFGVSDVRVYNSKLFVTMSSTPNTYKDTFLTFNLPSNPSQMPIFQGSVDNAPSINSAGLNSVTISGNYAYVTNANGANFGTCAQGTNCSQLQVIDVSDLASPAVVKSFKVPGVSGSAGQAIGKSVYYYNGYIYLGLAKTGSGPEFNIIDVGGGNGSPTNPIWKGGYALGGAVNSIFVKGNHAYVAAPRNENMTIIDISNPVSPTRVGGYTPLALPESNGLGSNHGKSLYIVGNTVYLGRTYGSTEFYDLNASTPGSITVNGNQDVGTGNQTSVNGVAVRDYLAFAITKAQFQVWNISNPASLKPWTTDGTTNSFLSLSAVGGFGTSLYCSGDYFYLAIASSQGNNKDLIAIITP